MTNLNLIAALAKARGEMGALHKNASNPHFRSSYADLNEVIDTISEPLETNGLLWLQQIDMEQGQPVLMTTLFHVESGESLTSAAPIPCKDPGNPQSLGSSVTYVRRYSLVTFFGLSAEDDDGNAGRTDSRPQAPQQSYADQVRNPRQNAPQGTTAPSGGTSDGPSEPQMKMIGRLLAKIHGSGFEKNADAMDSIRAQMEEWFSVRSRTQLTAGRDGTASAYIGYLKYIAGEDGGVEPPGGMPSSDDDGLPF